MIRTALTLSTLSVILLSGCSSIPTYDRPTIESPAAWSAQTASEQTIIAKNWWASFNSQELDALITQALSYNNDLAAAVQRVEQSRAVAKSTGASILPSIDGTAGVKYDRVNPDQGKTTNEDSGTAGLNISYELDLFGKNRAKIDAAMADIDSATYTKDSIALIVMGDVAKGYFNVLNLQERLNIADQNLESATELLRIVQARFDAGATTMLDVAQQKADLANTQAARAQTMRDYKISKSALAVLVGKPPQSLVITGKDLRSLSIPDIAAGQPSTLLERRPDIMAAESELKSANADIGAARAAFFPSLTLGVDATLTSISLGDPATMALSAGSSLLAPIFKGRLLQGNLNFSKAKKAELVEDYRKTILISFKEVEDALANVQSSKIREDSLNTAVVESQKAYDLSQQQYDVGEIDFQSLLDIRRMLLSAQDSYIQTKNERLSAAVDLYKSLGGGWQKEQVN